MRRVGGFTERSEAPLAPWRWTLAALLLVLHVPPGRAQVATDLDVERVVRKVEIHGSVAYKAKELRKLLRTRGSSFWKPWQKNPLRSDFIRADRVTLTAFYRRHGYLDALVDSVPVRPVRGSSRLWDVHFYLTEGRRAVVDTIRIEGTGPLSEPEFRKALRFRAGSPLDLPIVQASRDSVVDEYAERGYVLARVVDSLEVHGDRVSIAYRVEPGPRVTVERFVVEGTQKTKPSFVSREMLLSPGDVVRRSKLVLSQQRVYDSGLYSDVQMELGSVDSATHRADIIVSVREQKMGWIDAGIGYGNVDQLRLTGQWGQRSIFRSSVRFIATGQLGLRVRQVGPFTFRRPIPLRLLHGDRRLDVALTHPWPLGVRMQTTLGAYMEDQPVIEVTDEQPLSAYGGSILFSTPFLRDTRTYTSYELRHVEQDTLTFAAGGVSYTTNRIAFTSEWDSRRDIFNPREGADLLGKVELVTGARPRAGGFANIGLQGTGYLPLKSGAVLAVRLRGGYIEPWSSASVSDSTIPGELNEIPPDDRYRTGGASTVRGYLENELGSRTVFDSLGISRVEARGGQVLLLASAEIRFPLVWILSGAAFFDAGNVWERPEDINLSRIFSFAGGAGFNDMRYSGGVGLRIGTPVGPIRFDYGWKIRSPRTPLEADLSARRGEFHFSLGYPY